MDLQRTDEWFAARLGRATASRFKDVLAKIKSGEAAARRQYRADLIAERLSGQPVNGYTNAAMAWGTEQEPFAREAYMRRTGNDVMEVGFIAHPELMAGASPDGFVGEDGIVELKAPTTGTHIDWILGRRLPAEHIAQCQGLLWICDRQWLDFVSFDPRLSPKAQLFVVRVERDDKFIESLETEVRTFLDEVDATLAKLEEIFDGE